MKWFGRFALLLAVAGATSANAELVTIRGNWTCADWAMSRSGKNTNLENYLVGFLNGASMASARDFWGANPKIELSQAFFWMDKYCDQNPLGYILQGGFALLDEKLGKGWNADGSDSP